LSTSDNEFRGGVWGHLAVSLAKCLKKKNQCDFTKIHVRQGKSKCSYKEGKRIGVLVGLAHGERKSTHSNLSNTGGTHAVGIEGAAGPNEVRERQ